MATRNNKRNAMLLMALCAVMWSIGGIFIKLISWNPLMIAGARSIISAAIIAVYMIHAKIPVKICRYSVGAGIGLSTSCIFFVIANKLTTAANAIVLQYAAPIFILIMTAVIFKQRLRRREIIVVACAMVGIVLFFFDQLSPGNILGNIFGILAGIFLALMFVMVGQGGEDDSIRMSGILLAHCITTVIGLPIGIATTTSVTGHEILYVAILGVFQLGIPYVLYAIASRDCPPLACSLIGMLEPLLNPIWVAIFAGEMPGTFALIGAAIIILVVTSWCILEARGDDSSCKVTAADDSDS
jgi:drug/metabolite transporter (DMT)-like permease